MRVSIYFDTEDKSNQGWAYRYVGPSGEQSGELNSEKYLECSMLGLVNEANKILGLNLSLDDFENPGQGIWIHNS